MFLARGIPRKSRGRDAHRQRVGESNGARSGGDAVCRGRSAVAEGRVRDRSRAPSSVAPRAPPRPRRRRAREAAGEAPLPRTRPPPHASTRDSRAGHAVGASGQRGTGTRFPDRIRSFAGASVIYPGVLVCFLGADRQAPGQIRPFPDIVEFSRVSPGAVRGGDADPATGPPRASLAPPVALDDSVVASGVIDAA